MNYSLFISCPKGLEYLLEEEVKNLNLQVERVSPQGVYGQGDLRVIYQLCLWSRLANRVQLQLFKGEASNEKMIYSLCKQFPWQTVFEADKTIAIEFHGSSADIRNSMFGAQVVKDGIVDYFREINAPRPSVDRDNPQVRIHAYLKNDLLSVNLDLTGYSLHQRGYRLKAGDAPLKENLAAAMLIRAKWPQLAADNYSLADVFCGSGTIVIEAAMIAGERAPGLLREDQAFIHWVQHESALWEKLRLEALEQAKSLRIKLEGSDHNLSLIQIAQENARRAGVASLVKFEHKALEDCRAPTDKGLLISNPPYGERLSDASELISLYQQLGTTLHNYYQGWQAAILTSNPLLAKAIGLRASKQYALFNAALECKLYTIEIDDKNQLKGAQTELLSANAQMLVNRLRKNYNHLQKWAARQHISCYRVYDADLPDYAYAIDIYNDHAVLQEYKAPAIIAEHKVEKRSLDLIQAVPLALGIAPDKLVIKQRKRQKGKEQYQKMQATRHSMVVQEGAALLKVNLYDYLDTGLFLDHRPLRLRFSKLKPRQRFLNCFCYTATASVHAALAGAITTNVDLSKTYLNWAEENFKLNKINLEPQQFVHADCVEWLKKTAERFDIIFLDPPSFSNSKRMDNNFDLQRDHQALIESALRLLNPEGTLYFSTNFRQFSLAPALEEKYRPVNISAETIDEDFKRNQRIHHCFKFQAPFTN